jgi:3-deoxy-manno-octulosonate cytidylyltransferase (CMP-KDO synthetase)
MPVLAVIPARLGSTRLPHKPLQLLAGEPLVVRVARHVRELGRVDEVVVATDAAEVEQVVRAAGFRAVATAAGHRSGTDRVVEVARRAEFRRFEEVVNVQGDEPFLPLDALVGALERIRGGDEIGTAAAPLDPALAGEPARVKVVTDREGRALYFSRAAIPYPRVRVDYWQHMGLYAFPREALERWRGLSPTPLEAAEGLEQLRALEHGMRIGVARLDRRAPPGIDTPEDLLRAEAHWHHHHEATR